MKVTRLRILLLMQPRSVAIMIVNSIEAREMSLPQSRILYHIEEYLELERQSEERHEFCDGQVWAMAGESPELGTICTNLTRIVSTQLLGTPCQTFSKDTKVFSGPTPRKGPYFEGMFSYPDLVVVCGELIFQDEHQQVILNPTVIIEVLSPSTKFFDRNAKRKRYHTWLPTLRDYLMVAQSRPQIDHDHRPGRGKWLHSSINGLESSVHIASIGCTLKLADVYDRIALSEPPAVAGG